MLPDPAPIDPPPPDSDRGRDLIRRARQIRRDAGVGMADVPPARHRQVHPAGVGDQPAAAHGLPPVDVGHPGAVRGDPRGPRPARGRRRRGPVQVTAIYPSAFWLVIVLCRAGRPVVADAAARRGVRATAGSGSV